MVIFGRPAIFGRVTRQVTFEERLEVGKGVRLESIWKKRYNPAEKASAES